jgi:hypothetical protein
VLIPGLGLVNTPINFYLTLLVPGAFIFWYWACLWLDAKLLWITLLDVSFGLLVLVELLVWFPPVLVAGLFLVFWSVLLLGMFDIPICALARNWLLCCMLELIWLSSDLICINLLSGFHMTLLLKLVSWYLTCLMDVVSCCWLSVFSVIAAGSIIFRCWVVLYHLRNCLVSWAFCW